jgi:hypothetical protein
MDGYVGLDVHRATICLALPRVAAVVRSARSGEDRLPPLQHNPGRRTIAVIVLALRILSASAAARLKSADLAASLGRLNAFPA